MDYKMSIPHKVFIQKYGTGRLQIEERLVVQACKELGIEYEFFTAKNIHRRNLQLTANTMVVGYVDSVRGALKQLNCVDIPIQTYPSCLAGFYHRHFEQMTLKEAKDKLRMGIVDKAFIKPAQELKGFTGLVVREADDYHLLRKSNSMKVWVAEVIDFVTEYRAYVCNGNLELLAHYAGEPSIRPCLSQVEDMLLSLVNCQEFTASSFALDVGVMSSGQTAVVEVNEGYSLGAYDGVSSEVYFKLLCSRWFELQHRT